jgi:hypothetical protein
MYSNAVAYTQPGSSDKISEHPSKILCEVEYILYCVLPYLGTIPSSTGEHSVFTITLRVLQAVQASASSASTSFAQIKPFLLLRLFAQLLSERPRPGDLFSNVERTDKINWSMTLDQVERVYNLLKAQVELCTRYLDELMGSETAIREGRISKLLPI